MNKKKIFALVICIAAIIAAAIFYFLDGNTITVGTWSNTPIEYLNEFAGAGAAYTEIKTVDLGENGAVMFYTEKEENLKETVFNIGFFKAKTEDGVRLYTHYSSYAVTKDALSANNILLEDMADGSQFYSFVAVSQLSEEEISSRYPLASGGTIGTIDFDLDGAEYSLRYIIKAFDSEAEAQSFSEEF